MSRNDNECRIPPVGWYCTRIPGHEGPCAAYPEPPSPRVDAPALPERPKFPIQVVANATPEMQDVNSAWETYANIAEKQIRTSLAREERLTDLVRYMRGELFEAKLITHEEYVALVADSAGGQRVARLEGYDAMREQVKRLTEKLTYFDALQSRLCIEKAAEVSRRIAAEGSLATLRDAAKLALTLAWEDSRQGKVFGTEVAEKLRSALSTAGTAQEKEAKDD